MVSPYFAFFPSKLIKLPDFINPKNDPDSKNFTEISLKNLLTQNEFNRGALICTGNYTNRDLYSIMASKIWDINKCGFCFWSYKYIKKDKTITSSQTFLNEVSGAKYLIMTYTANNRYAQSGALSISDTESIDAYLKRIRTANFNQYKNSCITEYKDYNTDKWKPYPQTMFPSIIAESSDEIPAYLISDLFYSTEKISKSDLCSSFRRYTLNGFDNDCMTYSNRPTHALIEIKSNSTLLTKNFEKTKEITFIIAKLKAPYMAKVK